MTAKILYSGTTVNQSGPDGFARSRDGLLDIKMPEPHPAAENLFGAAWSACFMSAIGVVAGQRKVTLPIDPSIEATIEVLAEGSNFFLRARLNVIIPGVPPEVAQELIDTAHDLCPYSKAVKGNVEVELNLVELQPA